MITEGIIDIFFNLASGFFSMLPDVSWSVDTTAFSYVKSFLSVVGYLLPMETVIAIIDLIIVLTFIRVLIAFCMTIWDVLPFA